MSPKSGAGAGTTTARFARLAVVDRGESARRAIHAARELEHEQMARGEPGLRSIALFTRAERCALFVREADEAVCLGDGSHGAPAAAQTTSPHGDAAALERALLSTGADAAWCGAMALPAQIALADLCRRVGIVFVGPDVEVLRRLADPGAMTALARASALSLAIPGRPRSHGADERPSPRCLEVQVVADAAGTTWVLGVRDTTLRRNGRILLEETPMAGLGRGAESEIRAAAGRLCRSLGYLGTASIEFRLDEEKGLCELVRIHPGAATAGAVTEATTDLDLVKLQLQIARGDRLDGEPPAARGHAATMTVAAENGEGGFAVAPAVIEVLRLATGPGIRVDTGYAEGDAVPAHAEATIARIVASGRDRGEARARLRRALAETAVVLRPGTTNRAFLVDILDRPEVRDGHADEAWVEQLLASGEHLPHRHADVALLRAAIHAYDAEHEVEMRQFYVSASRGRPRLGLGSGVSAELRYRGRTYPLSVACLEPGLYRVRLAGQTAEVQLEPLDRFESWLTWGGQRFRVLSVAEGADILIEVGGARHRISRADGGLVRAPSPAVVLTVPVAAGDEVEAGQRVMVLEAMKMEMPVLAPFAGRVRAVLVGANVYVDTGAPLLRIDAREEATEPPAATGIEWTANQDPAPEGMAVGLRGRAVLAGLRQFILGFDVDARAAKLLQAEYRELIHILPTADPELLAGEQEILSAFADLASVFRRTPARDDGDDEELLRSEEFAFTFARAIGARGEGLPASFLDKLRRALGHYGVQALDSSPALEEAVLRIFKARQGVDEHAAAVIAILERRLAQKDDLDSSLDPSWRELVDRLVGIAHGRHQAIAELAREIRYRAFDQRLFEAARRRVHEEVDDHLSHLRRSPQGADRQKRIEALVDCPLPLVALLARRFSTADLAARQLMLEVLTRRYYRIRALERVELLALDGHGCAASEYELGGRRIRVLAISAAWPDLASTLSALRGVIADLPAEHDVVVDVYLWRDAPLGDADALEREIHAAVSEVDFGRRIRRLAAVVAGSGEATTRATQYFTYRPQEGGGFAEERLYRGLHPMMGKRMHLWRLANFDIERLPSVEDVYLFHGVARENPKDERLFAIAEVRDLTPARDASGRIASLPLLERMLMEALAGIRAFQSGRPAHERLAWNRVLLFVRPPLLLDEDELSHVIRHLAPATEGLGIEQVVVRCRRPSPEGGELRDTVLRVSNPNGSGLRVTSGPPPTAPLLPLSAYDQKVLRMRQRGLLYPYEALAMLTPSGDEKRADLPPGEFVEYDLDGDGRFVPVARAAGLNTTNIVAGLIRNFTPKFPEGMARVVVLGDPSRAMGALAEPECRRINAAIDLAEERGIPVEWFALSAGAKISMESGTENMDWIAAVLRRIIEFTQAGGEVNVIVNGINVGAQPYWNAEATMLLHTRGILVMTPLGAMVLTGKQALDYSGSVSAEDNFGIGGYERVMGPNGQAQYWARDVTDAVRLLMRHYDLTYVARGETFPRPGTTSDPRERDICPYPHGIEGAADFALVGDIFSLEHNRDRKRPFSIRRVMQAVVDQDLAPLERWQDMRDAEIAVIWDAQLGGLPVCLIGIESQPLPRAGFLPADGPEHWTAGTLFPRASKKLARALNAASSNRPVVVLANLSGFDGSPESMRNLQLEYGAEIGRAVVNFRGPIVFCVVSRYHGGAYVVFSKQLNPNVEAAAIEGSHASVIGGAPAAAVVFAGEVQARTRKDPRVAELERQLAAAAPEQKATLRARLEALQKSVYSEKLGEVADEFDRVHSVQRALQVGSLDVILPPERLRPYLIEAVERGMQRYLGTER